mmetsp:Transcript_4645/g.8416  ORF Transcript_4645/g.8416 Transcript_4645/m.8416 type:complete len:278 (+) Transcript_4645:298-1131(+)
MTTTAALLPINSVVITGVHGGLAFATLQLLVFGQYHPHQLRRVNFESEMLRTPEVFEDVLNFLPGLAQLIGMNESAPVHYLASLLAVLVEERSQRDNDRIWRPLREHHTEELCKWCRICQDGENYLFQGPVFQCMCPVHKSKANQAACTIQKHTPECRADQKRIAAICQKHAIHQAFVEEAFLKQVLPKDQDHSIWAKNWVCPEAITGYETHIVCKFFLVCCLEMNRTCAFRQNLATSGMHEKISTQDHKTLNNGLCDGQCYHARSQVLGLQEGRVS